MICDNTGKVDMCCIESESDDAIIQTSIMEMEQATLSDSRKRKLFDLKLKMMDLFTQYSQVLLDVAEDEEMAIENAMADYSDVSDDECIMAAEEVESRISCEL